MPGSISLQCLKSRSSKPDRRGIMGPGRRPDAHRSTRAVAPFNLALPDELHDLVGCAHPVDGGLPDSTRERFGDRRRGSGGLEQLREVVLSEVSHTADL
jgi:hypothetical protein